jgi:signal transduction histidine kinase/HPt (histidine-containing phosphotransfer) domain-containing protein
MGRETIGSGNIRGSRPAAAGRTGRGTVVGFDRASLRFGVAVAVAGLSLALLLAGAIAHWRLSHAVTELERSQDGRLASETRRRVERLVSRDRSRLEEAAFSDDLYALIQRGPAPPDSFVHPAFADWFPRLYGDQFIGLYALDGSPLFVWSQGERDFASVAVTNPLLRMLDNREPTAGLVRRGDQLYWVAGVPVLPTNYRDPSQPIRGYLVVAQPFGAETLANLTGGQPFQIRLHPISPSKTPFRSDVASTARGDSAIVRFALADVFAQENTLVELIVSRAEFQGVGRSFGFVALIGGLLLAGFAALAWWAARRWVIAPASEVTIALQPVHNGQLPALVAAPVPASEWVGMTGAINRLIANLRTAHERLDRLGGAVRDGAWEHDFVTGEWSFSTRFRTLLGFSATELPASAQSFEQLIHPEDREIALVTIQASGGSARPVDLEARLRRKNGEYGGYRFQAEVQTDASGTPVRLVGRLIDLASERAAAVALADVRAELDRSRRTRGRLLLQAGADLAPHHPSEAARIVALGQALTEGLPAGTASTFELCELIEQAAATVGVSPAILPAPGLVTRVAGDATLVRLALTEIIANAARVDHDRILVRLERADARVRFAVVDRGPALTARDQQRIIAPLTTGEPPADATDGGLGLMLVREIVRTLGGSAGVEFPADGGTTVWFALDLAPVETPTAPVAEPAGLDHDLLWAAPEADRTFVSAGDPPADAKPARLSGPVSLVADETVVIDLDGPESIEREAVEDERPAILAQLEADGHTAILARQLVTAFLNEAPIHLAELLGAIKGRTADAAASRVGALEAMAKLIGARELAARTQAATRALETVPLPQATRAVDGIRHELDRLRRLLAPLVTASPAASRPAIDPETLSQIRSSLAADGQGLGTQLVTLFLAEVPAKLEALERAAAGSDAAALEHAAGDLKGMCGLVGAGPMADLCGALANAGGPEAGARVGEIRAEYERVRSTLEELAGAASA